MNTKAMVDGEIQRKKASAAFFPRIGNEGNFEKAKPTDFGKISTFCRWRPLYMGEWEAGRDHRSGHRQYANGVRYEGRSQWPTTYGKGLMHPPAA